MHCSHIRKKELQFKSVCDLVTTYQSLLALVIDIFLLLNLLMNMLITLVLILKMLRLQIVLVFARQSKKFFSIIPIFCWQDTMCVFRQ